MSRAIDPRPRPGEDPTPYLSHPDARYEIVDGEVVEKPPMGVFAHLVAVNLFNRLQDFLRTHRLGRVTIETMFILDAVRDLRRQPDVAFVAFDRWPADREVPEQGDWDVVPDLVVEIISPNDRAEKVDAKVREYFHHGVRQVWHVFPQQRRMHLHVSPRDVRILDEGNELDGGSLLPGFRTPLAPLFRRIWD